MPQVKRAQSYRWTVDHPIAKRAGKVEYFSFDVEFKALKSAEVTGILLKGADGSMPNEEFIDALLCGWYDMQKDDQPWVFSVAAVIELCSMYPGMTRSISVAWAESTQGGAARKN